ncbi:hypothetical protein PV10_04142 [Exophiala mesophila]|uniref:Rhodopsin domain-containing protein n=1 Tax=Exophiala mesophila TaxID=212818 RepID=A0A0D2A1E9_EXOME|nr:uncharacterized protein PV10_04142 [Exophiala mesophila]KIV92878.1 hypothetical protein PV10_04142 [Exophiala mesophila]
MARGWDWGYTLIIVLCFLSITATALTAVEEEIPECSTSRCLSRFSDPPSPANQTIFDSFCRSVVFDDQLDRCLYASCTIREALATKNVIARSCEMPVRNGGTTTRVICSTFGVIALISVAIRLTTQWTRESRFGVDDCLIAIAFIASIPTIAIAFRTTELGVGKDIWIVYANATEILKLWYVGIITYLPVVVITRMSIYVFYLRIFSASTTFRRWVYVLMILNVLAAVLFVFLGIFQCRPISYAWTLWDGQHRGKCLNVRALGVSSGFVNVVFDFVTLVLPMPILLNLNMRIGRKIQVIAMFCVGAFVGIVSTLRVTSLFSFWNTRNFTWDYNPVLYYSGLEIYVGIICACMPAMRQLVEKGSRKLFSEKRAILCFGTTPNNTTSPSSPSKNNKNNKNKNSNRHSRQEAHDSYLRPRPSVKIEILETREVRVTSEYRTLEEQLSQQSDGIAPSNWQTLSTFSSCSSPPVFRTPAEGGGGGGTELDMELDFITAHPDVEKSPVVARQDSVSPSTSPHRGFKAPD